VNKTFREGLKTKMGGHDIVLQNIKALRRELRDSMKQCEIDSRAPDGWIGSFGQLQSLIQELFFNANIPGPQQSQWCSFAREIAHDLDCWLTEVAGFWLSDEDFWYAHLSTGMLLNISKSVSYKDSTHCISLRKKASSQPSASY
jgi:hypothetical protein